MFPVVGFKELNDLLEDIVEDDRVREVPDRVAYGETQYSGFRFAWGNLPG